MHISLLCNAGLALTQKEQTLLVDVPNKSVKPFFGLSESVKEAILNRMQPYDKVCGLCYTHTHPDHCDMSFLTKYHNRWSDIPIYYPTKQTEQGSVTIGVFNLEYCPIPHAPMDEAVPPHTALFIKAGENTVYVAGDAVLDPSQHRDFLNNRKANAAFWNSMYLSRPETRQLLQQSAEKNYIYHMPAEQTDSFGIWKKCQKNFSIV